MVYAVFDKRRRIEAVFFGKQEADAYRDRSNHLAKGGYKVKRMSKKKADLLFDYEQGTSGRAS